MNLAITDHGERSLMRSTVTKRLDVWLDGTERLGVCAFTTSETERQALLARVRDGELRQPHPGFFVRSSSWESLTDVQRRMRVVRTLGVYHPDWTFSHQTAALVHGITTSARLLKSIHVTTASNSRQTGTNDVVRHSTNILESEKVHHIRVTPLARTVVDCCRTLGFGEGLAIADAALRTGGVTVADLETEVEKEGSRRGIRQARSTISLADGRAENGGESIARAVMASLGFVAPDLQVSFADPLCPEHLIRLDYLWTLPDGSFVAGELDGRDKYFDPSMTGGRTVGEVLLAERQRESHINALGIPVMRFQFAELHDLARFSRKLDTFGIPHVR